MYTIGSSKRPDWPLAVVIGAGGLGMAVARRLGQSHRLLIADKNAEHLEQELARLESEGYDAMAASCDVTRQSDIKELAASAFAAGPVRALCYVVGLSPSQADFRAIMAVNLLGAEAVAGEFQDVLAAGGAALFISSTSAHMRAVEEELLPFLDDPRHPERYQDAERFLSENATPAVGYWLSKAGILRLCQRHAATWGARGLRILSLSPGLIATPMGAIEFKNKPTKHKLLAATPLKREGTMLEVTGVIEFLLSDRASYISGTDILVDGGMMAGLNHAPTPATPR